jgi:hypothetical protein
MTTFAPESILVAKNWQTVQDIRNAVEQLRKDLSQFLMSLENHLSTLDWWQDDWAFDYVDDAQVYISKERWATDKDDYYAVWIGVEKVTPERIFGSEVPPNLYVWVSNRNYALARQLAEEISSREWDIFGEIDISSRSGYVIRDLLKQCLPEEVETYEEDARQQIIRFVSHYADVLMQLDPVIQQHLRA